VSKYVELVVAETGVHAAELVHNPLPHPADCMSRPLALDDREDVAGGVIGIEDEGKHV
jgi:hypothetical protein